MMQPFRTFSMWALQLLHNHSLVGSDYCHVSTNRIVLTWSEVQVSSYRVNSRISHCSIAYFQFPDPDLSYRDGLGRVALADHRQRPRSGADTASCHGGDAENMTQLSHAMCPACSSLTQRACSCSGCCPQRGCWAPARSRCPGPCRGSSSGTASSPRASPSAQSPGSRWSPSWCRSSQCRRRASPAPGWWRGRGAACRGGQPLSAPPPAQPRPGEALTELAAAALVGVAPKTGG